MKSKFDERPQNTIGYLLCTMSSISKPLVNLNWSYSPETLNLGHFFLSPVTSKFDRWPWKTIGHILCATSSFVFHFLAIYLFRIDLQSETPNLGQNRRFFVPCDLIIWRMTLINNKAPILYYIKLSASFHSHMWIQNGITVRKRSTWVKIGDFGPVWPWNLTDDREKQYGTFSMLFQALCIISKPSVNSKLSYIPKTPNLGQNWRFFVPCDLEIWRMTLKNKKAPLLCYFKLCASFHSHPWI